MYMCMYMYVCIFVHIQREKLYLKKEQLLKIPLYSELQTAKMTMWADNIKFVKDILDGKYKKIDDAVAEVRRKN